jgi:hypothetical protein
MLARAEEEKLWLVAINIMDMQFKNALISNAGLR